MQDLMSEINNRRASWLELFFDLVFVVAVAAVSKTLHGDMSIHGIYGFLFLFLPIWWTWMGFSYFTDQFEEEALWQRLIIFPIMFGVIILSGCIPHVVNESSAHFVITYLVLRIILVLMYCAVWYQYPQCRTLTIRYVIGFGLGASLWFVSLFFSSDYHLLFWGTALLIEMATPIIAYLTTSNIPVQISHMDERFGLFTLIVLGDTIVSVAIGVRNIHWSMVEIINSIAGFCCAIAMWRLYFRDTDNKVFHRALHGNKIALFWSFVYGYSHFIVFASISAFGVAIGTIIQQKFHSNAVILILFASVIGYLVGVNFIQYAASNISTKSFNVRFLVPIIIAALAFVTIIYPMLFYLATSFIALILLTFLYMLE